MYADLALDNRILRNMIGKNYKALDKEADSGRDCRGIRIEHRSGVQADGDPPFVLLLSGEAR